MVGAGEERAVAERRALLDQSARHRARLVSLIAIDRHDSPDGESQRLAARIDTPRAACVILDAIPAILDTDEPTFIVRFGDDGDECQLYATDLEIGDALTANEWQVIQASRANAPPSVVYERGDRG